MTTVSCRMERGKEFEEVSAFSPKMDRPGHFFFLEVKESRDTFFPRNPFLDLRIPVWISTFVEMNPANQYGKQRLSRLPIDQWTDRTWLTD